MSRLISYDYRCYNEECEFDTEPFVVYYDERDDQCCPKCGKELTRMWAAPTPLRASYHDGKDRGAKWSDAKKILKIKKESYNKPTDKRQEYKKEINEISKHHKK